ncbi:unnamed protein product [Rodentolepis nana]|uniref:C-type lectin domain-containing protein n=1 Tax=Rodentolepis nana TaxID=102285 RepID=A0A158QJ58_RODNA|nr:unnamed protein product [Rodentolepis nana]
MTKTPAYLHRNPDSPETDFVPLQVTIYKKSVGGDLEFVTRESKYIKVNIAGARKLEPPMIRIFRQVNLTHIGGSFAVLPKDCIHVVNPNLEDLLEVNITKVEGPLYAQLVNLRDPTQAVLSFRIAELRKGLIALQLLNYAEMLEKVFTLTLVAIDPFMQVSEPVNLRLVSRLQPVFSTRLLGSTLGVKPFVFQVFSLPLLSYTGAVSIVQKHNLQVVGYIDESMVRFQVLANKEEEEYFKFSNVTGTGGGQLQFKGRSLVGSESLGGYWTLNEIAGQQLVYAHPGSLNPSVDRFRLRPSLDIAKIGGYNRLISKQRKRRNVGVSESELELPVRIVRLYDKARENPLKQGVNIHLLQGDIHCFTSEELINSATLEAARADFIDMKFDVKSHPTQGRLVRRSSLLQVAGGNSTDENGNHQLTSVTEIDDSAELNSEYNKKGNISSISLMDLERGEVCYLSVRRDSRTDIIEVQQSGESRFLKESITVNILPKPKYQLTQRSDPTQPHMEVAESNNFAVLQPTHLRHVVRPTRQWLRSSAHNLVPIMPNSTGLVYKVTMHPWFVTPNEANLDAGRLVSLSAMNAAQLEGDMALRPGLTNLLRELEPTGLSEFTQAQIDAGDIVYVPPTKDIGPSDQIVEFKYTVSATGIPPMVEKSFRLKVLAEDNKKPILKASYSSDGELVLDNGVFDLSDEDTFFDRLRLKLTKAPKYGGLFEMIQLKREPLGLNTTEMENTTTTTSAPSVTRRKIVEDEEIPASWIVQGRLNYIQDGSNVKEDAFKLTATDGHQDADPLNLSIQIRPRILLEPTWNLLVNNSIIVEENSTVTLHPSVFPALTPPPIGGPRFFVVVPPTKGKLLLDRRRKTAQFTTNDVANSRISYSHGPAEVGTKQKVDLVRIWDFKTGKLFSLNFTLLPVNSQPPHINVLAPLQVKEGGTVVLNHQTITIRDPDTVDSEIKIKMVTHPKWGHLELQPQNLTSIGMTDFAFSAEDLASGRVFYVNSRHKEGLESVSDIFSIRAYDEKFPSRESTAIHVSIHPVNDEMPAVRLVEYFAVPLKGRRVLTPYLFSVSDKDVPRDILEISFPKLPRFGHITVYWQHGEQYTITQASAPIAESYLGMMNLVYIQNGSVELPARDSFTVSVSDGLHVVKKSTQVLLRPENRYPPELRITSEGGLVLEGLAWRQLTSVLYVSDPDTSPEDLAIIIVRAPKLGQVERLQRQDVTGIPANEDLIEAAMEKYEAEIGEERKDAKNLREGDRFTKRQLDTGRIYYTYTGEYTSTYVYDSITLSVTDGQFESGSIDLPIRIRATKGRANPMVQSQSSLNAEVLDRSRSDTDALLSDAAYEPREVKEQTTKSATIYTDDFKVTVADAVEIEVGEHKTLMAGEHIRIEPIRSTGDFAETVASAHFQHLESETSRRECVLLVRSNTTSNYSLTGFTYKDITNELVMLSAESCLNKSPKQTVINLLLTIPSQMPISIKLPIKLTGELDNFPRPVIAIGQPLTVITDSDTPITLSHIQLTNSDMDPTKVYLYTKSGTLHWKYDCNSVVKVFSFYNIIHDDIVYHNHNGDLNPIELLVINLNHLEFDFNSDHVQRFVESIILSESSPLMQYIRYDNPDRITAEPLSLQINGDELYSYVSSTEKIFSRAPSAEELTRVRSGEMGFFLTPKHLLSFQLTTTYLLDPRMHDRRIIINMKTGETVTRFTQEDINRLRLALVVYSNPLQTKITPVGIQKTRMEIGFDVGIIPTISGSNYPENITLYGPGSSHTMKALIRKEFPTSMCNEIKARREFKTSSLDYVSDSPHNEGLNQERIHVCNEIKARIPDLKVQRTQSSNNRETVDSGTLRHSRLAKNQKQLSVYWAQVGFDRKRYRICPKSGVLDLPLVRRGALKHRVEVYVGLDATSKRDGLEVELLSPKLVTFEADEILKHVRIRVSMNEELDAEKSSFSVAVKAPSAAVLDTNSEAIVIINHKVKCHTLPYFTVFNASETGGERSGQDRRSNRMSLQDWLVSNSIPDSNALNKAYLKSMRRRKRILTYNCDPGWTLYESRCYRMYQNANKTWLEARDHCEAEHGYLASIPDTATSNWMKSLLNPHTKSFWIGLHKPVMNGGWIWHSMEQTSFTNWDSGFPRRQRGKRSLKARRRRLFRRQSSPARKLHRVPITTWRSSAAYNLRRHRRSLTEKISPRDEGLRTVCVALEPHRNMTWRNTPCVMSPKLSFICMKNPN